MEEHAANPPAGGEAVGMPQLDVSSYPNQIFWLIVALVAIYFILTRTALPRIAAVLAERRGTVTNDLAAAEDMKAKAQEAEDAYNKALADARAEASRIVAEARAEMQKDIVAAQEKADAEIAAKSADSERRIAEIRESAVADTRTVARDTAREIVASFGYSADQSRIDTAVDARVTERAS